MKHHHFPQHVPLISPDLPVSSPSKVIATSAETIRIRASMYAEVRAVPGRMMVKRLGQGNHVWKAVGW